MTLPLPANTTCDIYRNANAPPAAPDVAGVSIALIAVYGQGLEEQELIARFGSALVKQIGESPESYFTKMSTDEKEPLSRSETIDQALDLVAFREELAKGFTAVRRSGGVDDVLESRQKA